jgi:hypothetical protein
MKPVVSLSLEHAANRHTVSVAIIIAFSRFISFSFIRPVSIMPELPPSCINMELFNNLYESACKQTLEESYFRK